MSNGEMLVNREQTWPGITSHFSPSVDESMEEPKMTEMNDVARERGHFYMVSEVDLMITELLQRRIPEQHSVGRFLNLWFEQLAKVC